jgi:hypothetical protein
MGKIMTLCFALFSDAKISFSYGNYMIYDFIYLFLKVLLGFVHRFTIEQHDICVIGVHNDFMLIYLPLSDYDFSTFIVCLVYAKSVIQPSI